MKLKNILILFTAALALSACGNSDKKTEAQSGSPAETDAETEAETAAEPGDTENKDHNEKESGAAAQDTAELSGIDNSKWNYNSDAGVYWQAGVQYCSDPADLTYETLGIFVPEEYMNASDNGDGTYTCTIEKKNEKAGYTAETAPIVIPVNTPGYSAMEAPTDFVSDAQSYTDAGYIYVNAGCRGRDQGAPAGVTDLKAAVRYIRYCSADLPGNTDRIFTFGMSGGGAQSALMGATGDSSLYDPYLEKIGAVMEESDAVAGSMCWCPITNLDVADEAYEWNMGSTRTGLSEDEQQLSDGLAEAFADYINKLGLKDEDGNVLTLEKSETGICQAGSYYDYLKGVIETSLNHFLADTEFPYDASSAQMGGIGGPGGNMPADMKNGEKPEGMPQGAGPDSKPADMQNSEAAQYAKDGVSRNQQSSGLSLTGTYETPQDYIDALNADNTWVTYDAASNTATITGIEDFVKALKNASKGLGAFDELDRGQGENTLFGFGDGSGAHFDSIMAELLMGTDYESDFTEDLQKKDELGNTAEVRMNMYNPMYYLSDYYEGSGTSKVAEYWRIRSGIDQSDTALSTETDLALALENAGKNVDFETVWGLGHTMAERTGNSTDNFINWVNSCLANEK